MKTRPYTTTVVAAVAGVGFGALLGSRILRTILASTVSYAVVEVARVYLRDRRTERERTPVVRT